MCSKTDRSGVWLENGGEPPIYQPSSLGRAMLPGIMCQHEQNCDETLVRHSHMRGTQGDRLREEQLEGGAARAAGLLVLERPGEDLEDDRASGRQAG